MPPRPEQPADRDAIAALHREAFAGDRVADLVDALRRDDPAALSLVAEESGEVAGHIMFSRALLDAPPRLVPVQTLSPLAVAPRWRRRGLGTALIRAGLRELDARGVPLVFLEGDPRHYAGAGFSPAAGHGFRKPSLRIPDAAFQVARLSAYEPWMTGTFVYPDAFWTHDAVGLRPARPAAGLTCRRPPIVTHRPRPGRPRRPLGQAGLPAVAGPLA